MQNKSINRTGEITTKKAFLVLVLLQAKSGNSRML